MPGSRGGVAGRIAVAIIVIAFAITATSATAATTRAEYVAQVDPICQTAYKPEAKAAFAYLKALAKLGAEEGKPSKRALNRFIRVSAKFFGVTSRVEASITSQLAAVAPAPGDEPTVSAWLQDRIDSVGLLNLAIVALKHHKLKAFNKFIQQSDSVRQTGDILVASFGFQYCVSVD